LKFSIIQLAFDECLIVLSAFGKEKITTVTSSWLSQKKTGRFPWNKFSGKYFVKFDSCKPACLWDVVFIP